MFSQLYELLSKFKGKSLENQQFQSIKNAANKEGRKFVSLWKFKSQISILFKMAKFQSYLLLLVGLTALPYTLYQKYIQDQKKLTKILIFSPFGFGACLAPLILYKKFSKKLIQSISYNFQNKNMVLKRFRDGKQIYANLKDISYTKSDKGRIKQLIWDKNIEGAPKFPYKQTRKYQIQGLGQWESTQLFRFLVDCRNSESL